MKETKLKAKKAYKLTPKTYDVMGKHGLWTLTEEEQAMVDAADGMMKCDFCGKIRHFTTTIILDNPGWTQKIRVCHLCRKRPIKDLFIYTIDLGMCNMREMEKYSRKIKKGYYRTRIPISTKRERFRKMVKKKKRSKSIGPIPKVPDIKLPQGVWEYGE